MILALAVAIWFAVAGVAKLMPAPAAGRRALVRDLAWVRVVGRIRGVLEILGGLAVAAGGAISLLGLRLPFPGRAAGFGLAVLAAWTALDCLRAPVRPVRLALAVLGFALAVFFAGFRD